MLSTARRFAIAALLLSPAQETPPATPDAAPPQTAETPTAAARRAGFETVFGQHALLFFGVDDLPELLADWAASPWGRLAKDEAALPVRSSFSALLDAVAVRSKAGYGFDAVDTFELLRGRFAVTLAGAFAGALDPDHPVDFFAMAAVDAGEHAGEVRDRLLLGVDQLAERGKLVVKRETFGTREVVQMVPTHAEGRGVIQMAAVQETVAVGAVGGSYLTSEAFLHTLDGLDGEGVESLAQLPAFLSSLAALPGGAKLFVDTGALMRAGLKAAAADPAAAANPLAEIQRQLGLDQLGVLGARLIINADGMRLDAHQAWSGGALAKLLDAWLGDGDLTLLKLLPADAQNAVALHLDLAAGIDATIAVTKEMGVPSPFDGGGGGGDAAPTAVGAPAPFDVRKELLDHLDGRIAFVSATVDESESWMGSTNQRGEGVNYALVVGTKNAEALAASLDRQLRSQGLHAARRRAEFEGFQVYTLPMGPVSISYAIVADFLAVSPSPTLLQDLLRRKANGELANLAADPVFQRQLAATGRPSALYFWSKSSAELVGQALGASSFVRAIPSDVDGDEGHGGTAAEGSDPQAVLEERLDAFVAALEGLDPALITKHLPAGSVLALGCDQGGIWLEGVSQ